MIRKYVLPILALGMLCFAIYQVVSAAKEGESQRPPVEPARAPYHHGVAGAGIVEPRTENISVGSYLPGVVDEVFVKVGQKVNKGDKLFRLDDRQQQAELQVRQANLLAAEMQLQRLKEMPRKEEIPALEARVKETEENLVQQEDQYKRARTVYTRGGLPKQDLIRQQQAYRMAQQQLQQARAELQLKKAGAWKADILVAHATVKQAQAQVEQTRTELQRLTIRALMPPDVPEMEVLQVNVRRGEYVGAPPGQALIVLGNVNQLHVRVDVDEHDIPRFQPGQPAQATLRGDPRTRFELTFVRVEPYVIPKKSLTGDNTERVDTRVLQVIYRLKDPSVRVYVGQQLDVYIQGENSTE